MPWSYEPALAFTLSVRLWNPGLAEVLSFFLPGLGQLSTGQIINGIVWCFAVLFDSVALILPIRPFPPGEVGRRPGEGAPESQEDAGAPSPQPSPGGRGREAAIGVPNRIEPVLRSDPVDQFGDPHRLVGIADAWPLTHCQAPSLSTQTLVNRDVRSNGLPFLSLPASV